MSVFYLSQWLPGAVSPAAGETRSLGLPQPQVKVIGD